MATSGPEMERVQMETHGFRWSEKSPRERLPGLGIRSGRAWLWVADRYPMMEVRLAWGLHTAARR